MRQHHNSSSARPGTPLSHQTGVKIRAVDLLYVHSRQNRDGNLLGRVRGLGI